MQHIIEEHKRLELKIDMMASYVIIPHGGFYRKYEFILFIIILSVYYIYILNVYNFFFQK